MGTFLQPLRILIVEADRVEESRITREFKPEEFDLLYVRVETLAAMQEQLCNCTWDVVLSSYILPQFNALEALELLQTTGLDLPFIVLFDRFEEDAAIEVMKAGAHDCLLKGHLKRLVPTVVRELHAAEIRQQKRQTEAALLQLTVEEMTERRLAETVIYEFVSVLNHELRTPLTSLQASIELLQTGRLGALSERGQHLLEIAARNTDRLVQLTDRLTIDRLTEQMLDRGRLTSIAMRSNAMRSHRLMESGRDR